MGSPPQCRPECTTNSDCNQNEACSNQKCKDPCPGTCGIGAKCQVVNHSPICNCPSGFTGNTFVHCYPIRKNKIIINIKIIHFILVFKIKNYILYI